MFLNLAGKDRTELPHPAEMFYGVVSMLVEHKGNAVELSKVVKSLLGWVVAKHYDEIVAAIPKEVKCAANEQQ